MRNHIKNTLLSHGITDLSGAMLDELAGGGEVECSTSGDEPEAWFTATVSQDGSIIGIDHPTDADWHDVRRAHEVLRDRLNERLAEQERCPYMPAALSAQAGDGVLIGLLQDARAAINATTLLTAIEGSEWKSDLIGLLTRIDATLSGRGEGA